MADFDRAVDLDPTNDWRHFCRALVHRRNGDEDAARTELQTAITTAQAELNQRPHRFGVLFNAALYRTALGEFDAAIDLYRIGLRDGATGGQVRTALLDLRLLADVSGYDAAITQMIGLLCSRTTGSEHGTG